MYQRMPQISAHESNHRLNGDDFFLPRGKKHHVHDRILGLSNKK